MEPKFAVIALWAEDIGKAAHFYRDVLQLKLISHHDGRLHFDLNGVYLVILRGHAVRIQSAELARFPLFAISVADLEAREQHLEKEGIVMPWGIESDASARWIMFNDPAGNLIELVQFYQS